MTMQIDRKWIRPGRVAPIVTIIGSLSFVIAGWFDFVELTQAESVIVALLALLSVDSLVERMSLLEKIEARLNSQGPVHPLRKRQAIETPDQFAKHASSIHVLAISGISIVKQFEGFYRKKITSGCKAEFILLRPDEKMIEIWKKQNLGSSGTKPHIVSSLDVLRSLSELQSKNGSCEVGFLDMFAPFSIFGIDLDKNTAQMIVEFHGYKTPLDERAHILLSKDEQPFWFGFYRNQYLLAKKDSKPVDWSEFP